MSSHRGLSAIVGTVFLVAVVIGAMSYVSYSLDVMGNFSESLIAEESRQKDKQEESFEISSISINGTNYLDGVIKNSGEIPVEIKTLYIDEQGVNDVVQKFTLDEAITPGDTANLIDLVDFEMDPTKGYNMKVVSSRGEVNTFYVNSASQEPVALYLRASPAYVPSEFTTSIFFSVVNNMSNNNILYNVTPQVSFDDLVGSGVATLIQDATPSSYPTLAPGDVAIFEYVVQLTGELDDSILINATIANALPTNWVTATAVVKEVTVATQAGTALESFGLSTELSSDLNILNFHNEATSSPNGEYQMDGSDILGTGDTADIEDAEYEFITSNVTAITNVTAGNWNATFAYYNLLVPDGITAPDVAFMMEETGCDSGAEICDSTGNISGDSMYNDDGSPVWNAPGGDGPAGGKAYFSYDGIDDRHNSQWDTDEYSDHWVPGSNAFTTIIWVRVPATASDYEPIFRYGEVDHDEDYYTIHMGDGTGGNNGKFVFEYSTDEGDDTTTCMTDNTYDNGLWQHLAVTRDGDDDCKIYVNATRDDSGPVCNGCSGSSSIDAHGHSQGHILGGDDNDDNDGSYLEGDIAMLMHWDETELSAANLYELYKTNYGSNATRATINVDIMDQYGTTVVENLYTNSSYPFDYHDVSLWSDEENDRIDHYWSDGSWEKYTMGNFTFSTIANTTLQSGERLKFSIDWPGDTQNLPLHFRFGDDDFYDRPVGGEDLLSYFQTPPTSPAWPTFLSFDRDDYVTYLVYNSGPNGAWFTYGGTRFVITNEDATESYGGIIRNINGSVVDETRDSIYFPDQAYAELEFFPLKNPPIASAGGGTKPPVPETYRASVFLSGFDDRGEVFLRTINLGLVNVHDNG